MKGDKKKIVGTRLDIQPLKGVRKESWEQIRHPTLKWGKDTNYIRITFIHYKNIPLKGLGVKGHETRNRTCNLETKRTF